MASQIFVPIAVTFLFYLLLWGSRILYHNLTSPLRHVDGPKNPSLLYGNFKDMVEDPNLTTKWRNEFGANFRFRGLFSTSELHTSDLKAVNHIVARADIYRKPPSIRASLRLLLGKSILSEELEEHKRHRRIMNPAFGVAQIRVVTEIFVEKAVQLRDIWARQVAQKNGAGRVEVLSWLRHLTLDIIGEVGFNYQFDALDSDRKPNELDAVFAELFHSPHASQYNRFRFALGMVPLLRLVPVPGRNLIRAARDKMYAIGGQIVLKSKADIKASEGEKDLVGRRDLLSVLLRANLSANIPETQRLSDIEVISQIPTFFFAGHETTSSAAAWALHALSVNTAAQTKLRAELMTMSTDNPTMDELNSLPYLEHVRMAVEDDILPLSKPYMDKDGKLHDSLTIPKGQIIHIPILAINTDREIWGQDAAEFKPERWEQIPQSVSDIPGVWANLFTFFAGPHNCIGFRFSLVEMKALLFTLIRAFEFEQAVPNGGIGPVTAGFQQKPSVLGEGKGSGLPLIGCFLRNTAK
ncbi:cytochrome P450 [Mycena olivaceomarginata]|nr:cytochrome P450 [Mycena olivaceomarginata]